MKILISLTYYIPNISGLTIYAQRLAEGLAEKYNTVTILTSQHKQDLPLFEVVNKVRIHRVPVTITLGKGVLMVRFPFVAAKMIRKVDVVNIHLPQFEGVVLAILAKIYGRKVILTHHTDLSIWPGLVNKLAVVGVFISQFITGLLADKIVVYTMDYARSSYYLRWFRHKLVQIYPPIRVQSRKQEVRNHQKERPRDEIIIGFAGRIAKQKGIPHLLNAIPYIRKRLSRPFKIVFAGPDKEVIGENYTLEIKKLIDKYKDYLVFRGIIAPEKMRDFYRSIDVLVLPSDDRLESFGIVQVEAMLCGTPVVAVDLPGARVPIQKTGMGRIVEPANPQALAEGLVEVIENKEKYSKPKGNIEKIFNFQTTINTYEQLFCKQSPS